MTRVKRSKKGHNWKARQIVETKIDQSEESKVKLELDEVGREAYDESNALALPSQKRKTKIKSTDVQFTKKLSKKERRRLEKVLEKKDKKSKRVELLSALQRVQAPSEMMSLLTSTADMHSGKTKRKEIGQEEADGSTQFKINAIGGSRKKMKTFQQEAEDLSSLSESSDEDDDEEEDEEEIDDQDIQAAEADHHGPSASPLDSSPCTNTTMSDAQPKNLKNTQAPMSSCAVVKIPAVHVTLDRKPEIQEQRMLLPILAEEQVIMEAIHDNPVVVVCGETGSGKTTQVPQFLFEAGYTNRGQIAVTEPRRVAAISMSKRIAQEMNLSAREISYQIRYEGNITPDTKIKFMTDGVLLKEVQKDFLLLSYSVVIIDEAHERSVFTDILIGLLSRIVPLREKKGNPLKLVIMSATLRIEDFTENQLLFKVTPPVIKVDSRQFPVSVHFNKRTNEDYLTETYKKVCKIHRQLPEGGILVFMTGQQEVHSLCAKLKRIFPSSVSTKTKSKSEDPDETSIEHSSLPEVSLDQYSVMPTDEEAELHQTESQSDDEFALNEDDEDDDEGISSSKIHQQEQPLHVLPLFSLLPSDKQAKVFDPPPEGARLCVISTNVAETSLTIPNVKYVVDTGKVKTKSYDKVTGVSSFHVTWASQASANQRAGRAGRTSPGHCYRLYSSAIFNDEFEKFSAPEICRRPLDDLVLLMKDMSIERVVNFPYPSPPDNDALKAAESLLVSLGALEKRETPGKQQKEPCSRITALGRAMANLPVSPRYGKMITLGHQHALLPYVVAMVAALSVQEVFLDGNNSQTQEAGEGSSDQKDLHTSRRKWVGKGHSLLLGDLMLLLKAVGACEYEGLSMAFCQKHGIRYKAMSEVRKLRAQLTNIVNGVLPEASLVIDPAMPPPTELQAKLLRQILLAGLGDHIARKMPEPPRGTEAAKTLKYAYQSISLEDPVFIHPSSVLYKKNPEMVVYQHVEETSKLYMKGITAMEPEWLPIFTPNVCRFSKPLDEPAPTYNAATGHIICHMTSTCGPHFWPLPAVELEMPPGLHRFRLFARYLLDGSVYTRLMPYVSTMLTPPITMVKSWAKLQPKTETFLKALVAEDIDSKDKLTRAWKKTPNLLLKEYLEWLPQVQHLEVQTLWPPL